MAKPIKLDWDQLEDAFNDQNEELVYYLDMVTGHVHLEGEDEDRGDEEEFDTRPPSPLERNSGDPMRAYVEPPDTATKVAWFKQFMQTESLDAEVVAGFETALQSDDPGPGIREVLNQHPDVRDAWYVYRSDRIREMIGRWLQQHSVTATDPAPWN